MTPPNTLLGHFRIGQELTQHELDEAFRRIFGRPIPRGSKPRDIARNLAASQPLRFEFEINRVRGYAWDAEEVR